MNDLRPGQHIQINFLRCQEHIRARLSGEGKCALSIRLQMYKD